jgi:hypothetical protein
MQKEFFLGEFFSLAVKKAKNIQMFKNLKKNIKEIFLFKNCQKI